jgi:hypothetical protein
LTKFGQLHILHGVKTPNDLLYGERFDQWRRAPRSSEYLGLATIRQPDRDLTLGSAPGYVSRVCKVTKELPAKMTAIIGFKAVLILAVRPMSAVAQISANVTKAMADGAAEPIPPGTTINMQNWQQYRQFMPDGMAALFEGKYTWHMSPDVALEVGPTMIHPLPRNYTAATEKYAGQVQLQELPDGGLTLRNYQGGAPFPNPQQPHKGWKILANLWYRYAPHLSVITYADGCVLDHYSSINCEHAEIVERQLAFNTDPGIPPTIPGSEGKFLTSWLMVPEPEQLRYTANLNISYTDLSRPDDQFAFLPALRRYQPISTRALQSVARHGCNP